MWRYVSIGLVAIWILMLGLYIDRNAPRSGSAPTTVAANDVHATDEWMGVYHEKQKIGYTHSELHPASDGFSFAEDSLMRMRLLDAPQLVRAKAVGHADADLALRDVEFELHSGSNDLKVQAEVRGAALHIEMSTSPILRGRISRCNNRSI